MSHPHYPELRRLFFCKLNEVWEFDHPTADAALEAGIDDFHPHELHTACAEMDRLRAERRSPEALTALLHGELGANYLWEVDGLTAHGWVAHVASLLNERRKS